MLPTGRFELEKTQRFVFKAMSWVTVIWSMLIGWCIAMALPTLWVGISQRRGAHLLFSLAAVAVVGIAIGELLMMRASTSEMFGRTLQWTYLLYFVLVAALIGFVRLYFGAGRIWLGLTILTLRFIGLVINFLSPPNLNFREITALHQVPFLGETVSTAVGVRSPWTHLGELSSLLLVVFVVDAAISVWQKGEAENRLRAAIVCGSIAFFILLTAGLSALINRQVITLPYWVSFPFAAVLVTMAFELGAELVGAAEVAERLRLTEVSLHESETRFRLMADAAPVPIWMSGPDKLCTFFNKPWLDFTGRTMEQELGNGWSEGVHPDDFESCSKTYVDSFEARKPFMMQYRLRHQDGEYRWITDSGVARYDEQGIFLGYIGACVDVSELLKKDRELREFEQRVALAAEVAHMGVWELDLGANKLWVSDKIRELFDINPEEEVDLRTLYERVHPDDRAKHAAAVKKAIETRGSYEFEFRVPMLEGSLRWLAGRARCIPDETGELTRLLGVSMEVTNRKQAEELFQMVTEASPSGILLLKPDGSIVLVNAHMEELFGYNRDELTVKRVEELVPERFRAEYQSLRIANLSLPERGAMGARHELFALRKDGSEFPVEIAVSAIQTPKGGLLLASVVDISARKRAEEEAQLRRDEINRLTRISLIGEMAGSIAHEVNQPLGAMMANASAGVNFIDRGDADVQRLREILAAVVRDGRRARDVINNVRDTIKKGAAVRRNVALNDIIRNVMRMVQPDAAALSCELRISMAEHLPTIEADPIQIQQVLINLIGNAFDAMRDTPPNKRKLEIATELGDALVCVSVRDHGAGIADTTEERLFEQFYTTKQEGLGMGLAIVRSIIHAHSGTIAVENAEGGGARFVFALPVIDRSLE